jgi:signal transduction histidine kinase
VKIRTQFAFLIASIIIIPVILTFIISFIILLSITQDQEVKQQQEIMGWIMGRLHKIKSINEIPGLVADIPAGIDIIILDDTNTILVSTIDGITRDVAISPEEILGTLYREYPDWAHSYDPFYYAGKENVRIILSIHQNTRIMLRSFMVFRWLYVIFIFLLITGAVIGIIFLGSLRTSILHLEQATHRIAGGDLDFSITARGSDEIVSLTRSFDSMRNKLKEEYAKRSRFLMAVSHDLSTPLTAVRGYVEAIKDGFAHDPAQLSRYMSIISDRVDMLETRIDELIDFVRMETGEWQVKQQSINLLTFVQCAASIYKEDAMIFKRRFTSEINIPGDIFLMMDQNLCLRALENIFHNAIRYTDEEAGITFTVNMVDNEIHLIIRDTGKGIPGEEIEHIFDPFFRGKTLHKSKGFGLGLSIVKSIFTAHGWDIRVSSTPGEGTTFFIMIKPFLHNTSAGF